MNLNIHMNILIFIISHIAKHQDMRSTAVFATVFVTSLIPILDNRFSFVLCSTGI
jgi:hypothetical protein